MCRTVWTRLVRRRQTDSEKQETTVPCAVGRRSLKIADSCCGRNRQRHVHVIYCPKHCSWRCVSLPTGIIYFFKSTGCAKTFILNFFFSPVFSFLLWTCSLATLPTCLGSCLRLVWFALLYADVITLLQYRWNNSCSPLPFLPLRPAFIHLPSLIASDQLYLLNMTTGPLWGRPGPFALHAKESVDSWRAVTAAKGETASSLSSCYRWMAVLTDRRNKLAGVSRTDRLTFQGFFSPPFWHKVHFYSNPKRAWERSLAWCTCFVKVIQCKAKHLRVSVPDVV